LPKLFVKSVYGESALAFVEKQPGASCFWLFELWVGVIVRRIDRIAAENFHSKDHLDRRSSVAWHPESDMTFTIQYLDSL
jgi:hypothetical protein